MSTETIEVTIFGRQYPVVSNRDPKAIIQLAEIVDQKMKDIAIQLPDVSTAGIAVLACLNFADELELLKSKTKEEINNLDEMVTSVIQEIDSRLVLKK
ncbi:hypothetical protein BVX93_01050 [bacterium B13(2017)]|nr:hypothetical protein BVX93_01050 [bacterium B13(2017)]